MKMKPLCFALVLILGLPFALPAQDIGYFVNLGETNNPELRALRLRYDLAGEKVEEAGALPDTEFGVGFYAPEMQTRTGAQTARFSIRQMLPAFGQITAREAYAASMAEAEYLDWVIARRQLRLQIAQGYFKLQAIRQQIGILRAQGQWLDSYREVALTSLETGRASAVDVLRLEIRKNEVEARWQVLENQYRAASFAFFRLLNVTETDIGFSVTELPETLPVPEFPELGPHPELEKYDRLYQSVVQEETLNRKSSGPSFGVGVDYVLMSRLTDIEIDDNGMDMFMPMVSLSVPLFNGSYRSRTRQNQLRQESLEASKTTRRNQLESLLEGAWQEQVSERIRFASQTQNSARTRQAIEILLKNYQTDTVDFSELLEMQQMELQWQLERSMALEGFLSQGALVNYLTQE